MSIRSAITRTGFEALFFSGAHALMRPFLGGVGAILMFHHIRPPREEAFQPNRGLEVTPEFFESVIGQLRSGDVDLVSLDEVQRRLCERDFQRRFASITFDDGYRDNKRWAYPVLEANRVPFAVYVPTSFPDRVGELWWLALEDVVRRNDSISFCIRGEERRIDCSTIGAKYSAFGELYWWLRGLRTEDECLEFVRGLAASHGVDTRAFCEELCMSWTEIRELSAHPLVTIGAHTVSHAMLAKAPEQTVRSELTASRLRLQEKLGFLPAHLAYPYGDGGSAGSREFRIAEELGYKTAVTTYPSVLFPEHSRALTALPRLSVDGNYQKARYLSVLMSGSATALRNGLRRLNAA
jgi:peptidoglycan/xylan/chitin deacetylase (PgdA/CDA1 family)